MCAFGPLIFTPINEQITNLPLFKATYTVSAKFNRTRVQTAPVTLLSILQTRQWSQSKELEILLQKHPQHVKIEQFRPEKIEFKD